MAVSGVRAPVPPCAAAGAFVDGGRAAPAHGPADRGRPRARPSPERESGGAPVVPSIGTPIVCPVLVGRAPHLAELGRCLEHGRAGRGQVLLVSGEAGVGKSRLVAELEALAVKLGFRIVHGSCFEPDRSFPYAPLL